MIHVQEQLGTSTWGSSYTRKVGWEYSSGGDSKAEGACGVYSRAAFILLGVAVGETFIRG